MLTKRMAPFPALPARPCRNPDCAKTCVDRQHKKGEDGRHVFTPRTPWHNDCSAECRNHWHYLTRTKPKRHAEKSEKSGDENGVQS